MSFYLLNHEWHAGGASEESLDLSWGDQQTAGVKKSRETSSRRIGDDVGCRSVFWNAHHGILYNELSNYERDSLKVFDNSSAHLS